MLKIDFNLNFKDSSKSFETENDSLKKITNTSTESGKVRKNKKKTKTRKVSKQWGFSK